VGKFKYDGGLIPEVASHKSASVHKIPGQLRHGQGICSYDSGSRYEGQWQHDKREGLGKYFYACGDVYDGQWKNGLYNGTGRYSSTAGGDEYEGQWKDDVADGLGKYRYAATGDVYEGGFQAGLRSGHGKYRFANGNVYEGAYSAGERHGVGIFSYASGEVEVGRYDCGTDVGEGARWSADRRSACKLHQGSPIEPISLEAAASFASTVGIPAAKLGGGLGAPDVAATAATSAAMPELFGAAGGVRLGADGRIAW